MILIIVGVLVLGALIVMVVNRRRTPTDGVASFRRHIDALSPEARREVIDRVQNARESGKGK
ncbi:MAG TPA: hypothetical protein PLV68_18820 [Ilumatobacteraceae bacterium]|nr:hypothetical protein [Ilumatobacteraceae bacterium]